MEIEFRCRRSLLPGLLPKKSHFNFKFLRSKPSQCLVYASLSATMICQLNIYTAKRVSLFVVSVSLRPYTYVCTRWIDLECWIKNEGKCIIHKFFQRRKEKYHFFFIQKFDKKSFKPSKTLISPIFVKLLSFVGWKNIALLVSYVFFYRGYEYAYYIYSC